MPYRNPPSGRPALLTALAVLLLVGCGPELQETGPARESLQEARQGVLTTFTGQTSATTNSWLTHQVQATQGSQIKAVLKWGTATADLNLFVNDPNGNQLGFANSTTARPETVTVTANMTGTFTVALKCKTGSTSYTLEVTTGAATYD